MTYEKQKPSTCEIFLPPVRTCVGGTAASRSSKAPANVSTRLQTGPSLSASSEEMIHERFASLTFSLFFLDKTSLVAKRPFSPACLGEELWLS